MRFRSANSKMNKKWNTFLKSVYYSPSSPASFSSLNKLWSYIITKQNKPQKLTKNAVKLWLEYQDTASVHKPSRQTFPREKIIVSARDQMWDLDLADLSMLKQHNNGYTFILVVIDLLSRFCWLKPLKSKKGEEVKNAIEEIIKEDKRKPLRVRTDFGKEFYNKSVKEFFKEQNIYHFSTYSEKKANYAERLIKTIKGKLFKYIYDKQTYKYVDVLQDIAKSYNSTIHSSIKMAPADVTESNDLEVYMKYYMPFVNKMAKVKPNFSFEVGDLVRVAYNKTKFSRSYNEQYSEEIFTIKERIASIPPRYLLVDGLGEKIEGSFYTEELVFVPKDDERVYKIEKIIKFRKTGKKKEALIKWYGYNDKFNTWIPANTVKDYESSNLEAK